MVEATKLSRDRWPFMLVRWRCVGFYLMVSSVILYNHLHSQCLEIDLEVSMLALKTRIALLRASRSFPLNFHGKHCNVLVTLIYLLFCMQKVWILHKPINMTGSYYVFMPCLGFRFHFAGDTSIGQPS